MNQRKKKAAVGKEVIKMRAEISEIHILEKIGKKKT